VPNASSYGTTVGEVFVVAQSADGEWMSANGWGLGPVAFDAENPLGRVDGTSRAAQIDELRSHIEAASCDELLAADEHPYGVAVTRVSCIDQLFADSWGPARDSLATVTDDELGEVALAPVVPRFSRTPGRITAAAPRLDEHRATICAEWLGDDGSRHDVRATAGKERA
jgi:crotonobetainyl-CoA:carnitine CoA-transferase CaiB-like acyl-CoA transferase